MSHRCKVSRFIALTLLLTAPGLAAPGRKQWTQQPQLTLQLGHEARITAIAYSPDGKTLATGAHDGVVKLWDAATGELKYTLLERPDVLTPRHEITALAFAPDGKTLASGGGEIEPFDQGAQVRIWDAASGELQRALRGDGARIAALAFAPTGVWLVGGGYDDTLKVWDAGTWQLIAPENPHQAMVAALAFSPDGRQMASAGLDNTVKLWDARRFKVRGSLAAGAVTALAFAPDGKTLAAGSAAETMTLWDSATGARLHTSEKMGAPLLSVAYAPDGKTVACTMGAGGVRLYNAFDGQFERMVPAVDGPAAFSPDGKTLAGGTGSGETLETAIARRGSANLLERASNSIALVNTATWQTRLTLPGVYAARMVAYSPDGRLLASGGEDRVVRLWSAETGQLLRTLTGHSGSVWSVAFAPDGTLPDGMLLATASEDGTIKLWDPQTGELLHTLTGHTGAVNEVAFAPGGKTLASGSDDKTIKLWDSASGQLLKTLEGHTGGVTSVAFSPDGRELASSSFDKTARVWHIATDRMRLTLGGYSGPVFSVAFTHDGSSIIAGGYEPQDGIGIWDDGTGMVQRVLKDDRITHPFYAAALAADGKTLVAAGVDGVSLWDIAGTHPLWLSPPEANLGRPSSVAFAPDGQHFATCGGDGMIRLWRLNAPDDAQPLVTLSPLPEAAEGQPGYIAFTPEGYYAASPGADRYLRFRLGRDPLLTDRLKTTYNRPDGVRQALQQ